MEVIPGIQAATFGEAQEKLEKLEKLEPDRVHIDVVRPPFAANSTIGFKEIKKLKTSLPIYLHLMAIFEKGELEKWCTSQAKALIFYLKSVPDFREAATGVRLAEKKVGLAIDLDETIHQIEPFLSGIDLVLLLAVKSGRAGQIFDSKVLEKVGQIKNLDIAIPVGVDGGIKVGTASAAAESGADFVVANSAIWQSADYQKAFEGLKRDAVPDMERKSF